MTKKYDFSGWATKNDIECSDGRTIRRNAFKGNDGQVVPLVWSHVHNDPANVLGHALLENRDEGVYAYCSLNSTENGKNAKIQIEHGDIRSLSIYANKLEQSGGDVLHGSIREVSLVLAGANPGASIEYPILEHSGEEIYDEAIINQDLGIEMYHEDSKEEDMADEEKKEETKEEKTVQDVIDTMNEEQQEVLYGLIGEALEEGGDVDEDGDEDGEAMEQSAFKEEEEDEMKHNVFDTDERQANYLSHDDMKTIFDDAKRIGSLKDAVEQHFEDGVLAHAVPMDGMTGPSSATADQTYGFRDPDMLFPEYKSLNNPPEWIKRDTTWVTEVMNGAHHTPFSRIKSVFADITEDDARARGYIKGKQKKEEVFTLLKRTTDPQTIYKKQKLDRDDVIDITDFDVVAWIRSEMRVMLDEEIARAVLIGDGRSTASDDHISEDHIRPIATDKPLFSVPISVTTGSDSTETAKNFINSCIRGRKQYKGTGTPVLFTTADLHTEMLLIEDGIGHKLYKSDTELATALRVSKIVEVEVMESHKIDGKNLLGIIVNMADYNIGADKGGEINMFDDFDIDYNQMKYLIETRISGALTKPYSALVLTEGGASSSSNTESNPEG